MATLLTSTQLKTHDVYDPAPTVDKYVPGNSKGYTEGDGASFGVQVSFAEKGFTAGTYEFTIQLDVIPGLSSDPNSYAFTGIVPYDFTYDPYQDTNNGLYNPANFEFADTKGAKVVR
jgi:hypothetical protein